jgi:hypothetical protein
MNVAHALHPRSIARLHDDELSCLLRFLSLSDLARLVRCTRRFNALARKERCRGLHLEGDASVAPLPSSSLSHHVTSLRVRLHRGKDESAHFIMRQWDMDALMQGQAEWQTAAGLKAVLPTQLHTLTVSLCTTVVAAAFCNALSVMQELTDLSILHATLWLDLPPPALSQMPRLRKLTVSGVPWNNEWKKEVKRLSHVRELNVSVLQSAQVIALCEPPHSLRLEHIGLVSSSSLGALDMRALLQFSSSLTSLDTDMLESEA